MFVTSMVQEMCRDHLSDGDIKAIGKSRGFTIQEQASRAGFENIFLSDTGLDDAFASLSRDEIACLFLLSREPEPVDVSYFATLYPVQKNGWEPTFTQRYTPVFKAVQRGLVRKGVLLMTQVMVLSGNPTKMERWRFTIPPAFAARLPCPFDQTERFAAAGTVNKEALRKKLRTIDSSTWNGSPGRYDLIVRNGRLMMGAQPFAMTTLLAWQRHEWRRSVWGAKKETGRTPPQDLSGLMYDALSRLPSDAWVRHDAIEPLLRLFYGEPDRPDPRKVCEHGWTSGCLAKHTPGPGRPDYYRLPPIEAQLDQDPTDYLKVADSNALRVDLRTIPYACLECIAAIANITAAGDRLNAAPDFVRLGHAPDAIWDQPVTRWLREHSEPFRQAMEKIDALRGKRIVHDNLLLARVTNLSLRVQIQKALLDPKQLVALPNDYLAFPKGALADVQKRVTQSGFVIKTIEAPK